MLGRLSHRALLLHDGSGSSRWCRRGLWSWSRGSCGGFGRTSYGRRLLLGALLALLLTGTAVLTLLTFGRLLLATLGAIIAFCTLCTGLALSGCFGRRRSCRCYLRGRLLGSFIIALGTLLTFGALTAVVAVVIATVAIATTFASGALGLVIATLGAILLTALAALLAVITFLTLTTFLTLLTTAVIAFIAFVAFATLLTGLTTTALLTLIGLLLLRLSRSCGLGRSFLALLIVAVLLALATRLLTLEGLVIGALTK